MYADQDEFGEFLKCIQCGHILGEVVSPERGDGEGYNTTVSEKTDIGRSKSDPAKKQEKIDRKFMQTHSTAIQMRLDGESPKAIAAALGRNYDAVYNLVERVDDYLERQQVAGSIERRDG
jgi:hypothetical protein